MLRAGLSLQSLIPLTTFYFLNLSLAVGIFALDPLDLENGIVAIPRIETLHELWNQMRVFFGFRDGRHAGTGRLALPRARRRIAIREGFVGILLSLEVAFGLFLQQTQVQFTQSVGAQAAAVESRIMANQGHALQLVGNATEADGGDTIRAQGLEEKQRLEVGVGGDLGHEGAGVGAGAG